MRRFPREFADLLNKKGRSLLKSKPLPQFSLDNRESPYASLPGLLSKRKARAIIELLESRVRKHLRANNLPFPRGDHFRDFMDSAPNHRRMKVAYFNDNDDSLEIKELGRELRLVEMLTSDSMLEFLHRITGYDVGVDAHQIVQINCYSAGDGVGMHSDWYEVDGETVSYLDFHLSLPNDDVKAQHIYYQQGGYLTGVADGSKLGTIGVYRLPMWHQVGPMIPKSGREKTARRWLIMSNIAIYSDTQLKVLRK